MCVRHLGHRVCSQRVRHPRYVGFSQLIRWNIQASTGGRESASSPIDEFYQSLFQQAVSIIDSNLLALVSFSKPLFSELSSIRLKRSTLPWLGLANHIGQTCKIVSTIRRNSSSRRWAFQLLILLDAPREC